MRNKFTSTLLAPLAFVAYGLTSIGDVTAQEGAPLQAEGVSNDIDKKRRGPAVSVNASYVKADSEEGKQGGARGRILVDAYIPNPDYQKYPIRVDYFINRHFFTSQVRSTELPGPLGIDVGPDRATPPFNYTIVATLLHPNREFTTVVNGAVFESSVAPGLSSCSLTLTRTGEGTDGANETVTYRASDVSLVQTGNSAFSLSFESSELQDGSSAEQVSAKADFTITSNDNGSEASGSLTTTAFGATETGEVSGEASLQDSKLTSLSLKNEESTTTLSCQ